MPYRYTSGKDEKSAGGTETSCTQNRGANGGSLIGRGEGQNGVF
jgi:hypothetical protein